MALTSFFYWMLADGSAPEKVAAVSESLDIFTQICARVGPALVLKYGMSAEQVAFFTVHEDIGTKVTPIDALLLAPYDTPEDHHPITRALHLPPDFKFFSIHTIMTPP